MSLLARIHVMGALVVSIGNAQVPTVINPNFGNVPVACSEGYAYQSVDGGTCAYPTGPEQRFNSAPGIGWSFTPVHLNEASAGGITGPNTAFQPPSFTGFPFSFAALLQGPSIISQPIFGLIAGRVYTLSFDLGSRYRDSGGVDGNQTVQAVIDFQVIGTWTTVSSTPFTPRTAVFTVATSGVHKLVIAGLSAGDHTVFVSGVNITPNDVEP